MGNHVEELGYVALEQNTETYVLWLKDTCDMLGLNGGYIRGDEYPSMVSAKKSAASSVSAQLVHHMWMIKLGRESKKVRNLVVEWMDERKADGKVLTESSFRSYMNIITKKDRVFTISIAILSAILGGLATKYSDF